MNLMNIKAIIFDWGRTLYDVDTNDAIGVWDENKQEIILNELDEDSYVDEDNNAESHHDESDDDE
jgi:FMN phosphatase YigB (HAD superfamily)